MAKFNVFGFLEARKKAILGCNVRRGFVSRVRGNGENQL